MPEVHPNRPPKPNDIDGFRAYIDARADVAERQAAFEAVDADEIRARLGERRLLRLLLAMILLIVIGGFVISIGGLVLVGGTAQ